MRFASYILSLGLMLNGSLAVAQVQDAPEAARDTPPESAYVNLTLPFKTAPARLQKGQRANKLKALNGLKGNRFARRLGEINSISRGAAGQLYTTDIQSGRVFIIPDRDQNGRPEQIRPLPYRFNAPSAAVESGGNLYIADRDAIWKLPLGQRSSRLFSGQAPIRLANLQNTKSTGRYFLTTRDMASEQSADLTLGYSTKDGKARLISVNTATGAAQLIDETNGQLIQLAAGSGAKPWVAYRDQDGLHIGTSFDNSTPMGQALSITGMTLPQSDRLAKDWPTSLQDHVYLSRTNPVDVVALPTSLGTVLPRGREVFTGFQNGRTAWGTAGALYLDARGLFIADPFNGDLWVISPEAEKLAPKDKITVALDNIKAAKELDQKPLKRDPLEGVYNSLFPDPNKSEDANSDNQNPSQNTAGEIISENGPEDKPQDQPKDKPPL